MMQNIKASIVLMGTTSASLVSLVSIILLFIVLSLAITLNDFYSCLIQPVLHFLSYTWKGLADRNNGSHDKVPTCSAENDSSNDDDKLLREEVEIVMEKLGIPCDPCGNELQERIGSDEIASLFEENKVRVEEVREAFGLFDENSDGYMDAKELEKVLCKLGFVEFSERECQRMITAFDDNLDGRIDFTEFVNLLSRAGNI